LSTPIAINVNEATDTSSEMPLSKKNSKVKRIDINSSRVETLMKLEKLRHRQTKALKFTPVKMSMTKNKLFSSPTDMNDQYILSKLSKQKTYYKSIQSKMVAPSARKPDKKRRGSVGEPFNYHLESPTANGDSYNPKYLARDVSM